MVSIATFIASSVTNIRTTCGLEPTDYWSVATLPLVLVC